VNPLVENLLTLAVLLLVCALFSAITAVQARRRGYSFFVWLLAGTLGNSIFLLILLGVMPDFRRRKLREQEAEDLRKRLRRRGGRVEAAPAAPPGAEQVMERSLGDVPTRAPDRSLGDDETRL
jgi:hypothetical protein